MALRVLLGEGGLAPERVALALLRRAESEVAECLRRGRGWLYGGCHNGAPGLWYFWVLEQQFVGNDHGRRRRSPPVGGLRANGRGAGGTRRPMGGPCRAAPLLRLRGDGVSLAMPTASTTCRWRAPKSLTLLAFSPLLLA
jgi:hypothetical protein